MIAGYHCDRTRLIRDQFHRPLDGFLGRLIGIEEVSRQQHHIRVVRTHLFKHAIEHFTIVVARIHVLVVMVVVSVQMDVGAMGNAQDIRH